jgi:hypothetical protein
VRLLRLYPKAWRQRYEAEMQALLDQHEVTIVTRLDLLRGAVDASLFDRRFAMSPTLPALRGARLGLVPCAFVMAHYLLSLDLNADTTLLNLLGTAGPASLAAACLWVGKREAEHGTGWAARLVAGGAAGAAGTLAATVVQSGLLLADVRFAITSSVIALQGGLVSGDGFAVVAGRMLSLGELEATAVAVGVAGIVGAVIAAAGAVLRGVRITRLATPA